jgi:hypothetical protein
MPSWREAAQKVPTMASSPRSLRTLRTARAASSRCNPVEAQAAHEQDMALDDDGDIAGMDDLAQASAARLMRSSSRVDQGEAEAGDGGSVEAA